MNRDDITSLVCNIRATESAADCEAMLQVIRREWDALEAINAERGKVIAEQAAEIAALKNGLAVVLRYREPDADNIHPDDCSGCDYCSDKWTS